MALVRGHVGKHSIALASGFVGSSGAMKAEVNGQEIEVKWIRDSFGITLELPHSTASFEVRPVEEEGAISYQVSPRLGGEGFAGARWIKEGDVSHPATQGAGKKVSRIKAQMPGKLVKLHCRVGDEVKVGQPVLVMEAMKMENEIKAPASAKIKAIHFEVGVAVEAGAVLVTFE